jgi:type I restriction enzyme S subunit
VSWGVTKIGLHLAKVLSWNPTKSDRTEKFRYIDLSSVNKNTKTVCLNDSPFILPKDSPSRARQIVNVNDVILSTVRPNLNGVAIIPKSLENATASTGYCILRVNGKSLDSRYLYYWVQTNLFINDMTRKATGANYPAVSDKIIKESLIPIPFPNDIDKSLVDQKRIANILDKAEELRKKRRYSISLTADFLHSVFLDMFGDPVTNPKNWQTNSTKFGLETIKSGWSAMGNNYPCDKDELGVLKISAVTSGIFKPEENKFVDSTIIPKDKKLIFPNKGDLLFSRANTRELVAATCIVTKSRSDVFLPDKLWSIKTDTEKLLPEFLHFMVQQPKFKDRLTAQATGSSGSMLNISKAKFEDSIAIFPPIELQKKFRNIFWQVNKLTNLSNNSMENLTNNFNSLSQKAFAGEL